MTNSNHITRDGTDSRHHPRLKLPSLSVVIEKKSYPVNDFSLSGCGIKTGKSFSKALGETVSVQFSMRAFGKGNHLILQATIVKEQDENDLVGLSFKALSGGQKEILRYILTTCIEGKAPDRKKLTSLFEKKEENDSRIVHAPPHPDNRQWTKYFPSMVFVLLFSLAVVLVAKTIFFPSPYIIFAERAVFVSAGEQDFTLPEAGAVLSLVSADMNFVAKGQPLVRLTPQEGEETILHSPCDCFILERAVMDKKSFHPAGFRLFSLVSTVTPVLIDAYVPVEKMQLLYVGMKAEISLPGRREKIPGLITAILSGLEKGTSKVIIKIRPGTLVPVNMIGKESRVRFLF